MSKIVVCALYKFVRLPQYESLRKPLLKFMLEHNVRGTLLLANEGINGTVAATRESVDALLDWLRGHVEFADLDYKESYTEHMPFLRTKVKLKKEIVTMGVEGIDPNRSVGTYVDPKQWNDIISDPDTVLVDTRNDYEYEIGTFKGALNPNTTAFREFPSYVQNELDPKKPKKVAMFCTGGIRCEKSTAFLKEQGYDEVYHLKGGILKYLEEVPKDESLWEGECFVFDDRVSVNHDLEPGQYDQCHACRFPITEQDKQHDHYELGVSCPRCFGKTTDSKKASLRERQHQIDLMHERGFEHLGNDAIEVAKRNREEKLAEKERQRILNAKANEKKASAA